MNCVYGEVLYRSMRYIKGKCPSKLSNKFKNELSEYLTLWDICLMLLLDEIINKSDNFNKLTEYLNSNRKNFSYIDFDNISSHEIQANIPFKTIKLLIDYVSEINIEISDYKNNYIKINRYLFALHNLPRCLLSPSSKEYICQNDAVQYSQSYLKQT
ncbi:MAG: hypothetical protein J1E40_05530 [Oscillospiraceae bacterium]|nr:hypothetical protein [Oscillospiraceae bacterium]